MKYLLLPFSFLYGTILKIRRKLYEKRWLASYTFTVPTIGVGNLRVGGTGKTPHIEFLIHQYQHKYKIATLSRGYGRQSKGYLLASTCLKLEQTASFLGDEPMQFFEKFPDIEVAVCENRRIGINRLLCEVPTITMILLDDVFQHLSVQPSCQILLTEYSDPYYNDYPFPAGKLREFPSAAKAANIIIVTKTPANISKEKQQEIVEKIAPLHYQSVFFSTYIYEKPKPVTQLAQKKELTNSTPVILVTGIAKAEILKEEITSHYHLVKHYPFPDHYHYQKQDIEKIYEENRQFFEGGGVVFTTEKDVMRLMNKKIKKIVSLQPLFSLPIRVEILFNEQKTLIKKINSYVTKDQ